MNLELSDDLKSNFRSWESDHENDAEGLAGILSERHPEIAYSEILETAKHWVGAPEEPEEDAGPVPKPLVDAYKDLDTNFRAWMTDHEDQADRLADMLVERHRGLNRDLAGILARQWVKPE